MLIVLRLQSIWLVAAVIHALCGFILVELVVCSQMRFVHPYKHSSMMAYHN